LIALSAVVLHYYSMLVTILIGDWFLDGDSNPEYILFLLWILYSSTIKILAQPAVPPAYAPHSLEVLSATLASSEGYVNAAIHLIGGPPTSPHDISGSMATTLESLTMTCGVVDHEDAVATVVGATCQALLTAAKTSTKAASVLTDTIAQHVHSTTTTTTTTHSPTIIHTMSRRSTTSATTPPTITFQVTDKLCGKTIGDTAATCGFWVAYATFFHRPLPNVFKVIAVGLNEIIVTLLIHIFGLKRIRHIHSHVYGKYLNWSYDLSQFYQYNLNYWTEKYESTRTSSVSYYEDLVQHYLE